MTDDINKLLDEIFRDASTKHGLGFFDDASRQALRLRRNEGRIQIFCAVRSAWKRAKPEEVVRQLFVGWIQRELKYPLNRIRVERPLQAGADSDKERMDVVVYGDDACTDPFIVFEVKRPGSSEGIEQMQSYLRWTGCFFGCWSNGNQAVYQLREEDAATKKAPYKYRDVPRLPRLGEDAADLLQPLTYKELEPLNDLRGLISRLEHDVLSNAGVNTFEELFKLFFAKLHDELKPGRKPSQQVEFRVTAGQADSLYKRINGLFQDAKKRPHWKEVLDSGDDIKLKGDALRLAVAALERFSLSHPHTDLEVIDAAFEYLINPEQKGEKGQYFTPRPVVKMAVEMIRPKDGEKVVDPACGSCGFLIHTIRHIERKYGWNRDQIYKYANDYLYGVDFDDRLRKVAKTMMIIAGDGKANIHSVNALDVTEWQNSKAASAIGPFGREVRDGDFSVVLTNPPFAGKLTGKTKLAAFDLYELAVTGMLRDEDGDADEPEPADRKSRKVNGMKRDVLFVERCLDMLRPGGRMAIVLPQGNLNNSSMRALRTYIADRARLLAVVGLHVNTFKPFTGTKTSVVFLQKWGAEAGEPTSDYDVFMATSRKSGKDNSGRYRLKRDALGNIVDAEGKPVVESRKPAAIDHDLDEISAAFFKWGKLERLSFLAGESP